ncbi:ammonium transporter [Aliiglaciecola sp. NS0011-25]|uniref:ammonium transporter n=1 Tax=Aliiglaciecola sp. NS0011-25 TaxID=3127654 RepID=UPI00310A6A52
MSDNFWLLLSAMFVFLMQAGFLCLESGRTRSKNSINVAAKNIGDFIVSASIFWLFGFGIMFGPSLGGWAGTGDFAFGEGNTSFQITFFLFQMMFCSTAATLTSGAIAERARFSSYMYITLILSGLIYPFVGHWAWAGVYNPDNRGWLESLGFVDFAGSTVVHSVGGWVALASVLIVGPRIDRFKANSKFPSGSNLPLAAMGTLLIWFGWFGFNGGSTLKFDEQVPYIILNTCLAAMWGGLTATFIHLRTKKYVDMGASLNGIIAGLVAITASCHAVAPVDAAIIGVVAGIVVHYGSKLMDLLKVDDALNVIPTHLFAGIWGTLAVAFFGEQAKLGTGLSFMSQLTIQLLGVVVIGLFSFLSCYFILLILNKISPLRVTREHELSGLNISEHKASTELIDLLDDMQNHQNKGDFTLQVKEEPFTEVGQIARKYNEVISKVSKEMTQREKAINQFKISERRKSAILDSSMDCIVSIDWQGNIIEFNPAAERTFGCLKAEVMGQSFINSFALDKDIVEFSESLKLQFVSANGLVLNRRSEIELKRAAGQTFPAEVTITSSKLNNSLINEFTLHIRDVTKQQKIQARLNFLAYHDPLTHLSNRTHLITELNYQVAKAKKHMGVIALFFLDLDKFKKINDTLGHKAGDYLLCQVANRLKEICREEDIIARLGGDEFIVVMTGELNQQLITEKAQRILSIMREPITLNGKNYQIATSVGVAVSTNGELGTEELIQRADIAMYNAKFYGRDNFKLYTEKMGQKAQQEMSFERKIGQAIEQDEFSVVYQPKVKADGEILSLEALIRWQQKGSDEISPNEFIPIAEQSNLIVQIGEIMMTKVLEQLRYWLDHNSNVVPVAINISGRQLVAEDFIRHIKQLLKQFSIPGELLEFEITEGILIQDIQSCIAILQELKGLHIKVSIDDFGTGYSSLSYLKKLPLDILKIDRSFVHECDSKTEDAEICATIINLAKSLNLMTVAEGVETHSQFNTLQNMGCDLYQGYLFHQPQGADAVFELLNSQLN